MDVLTTHATDRALDRLALAGIPPKAVLDRAAKIAARLDHSAAVRMVRLDNAVGDSNPDIYSRDSNGNDFWVVIRGKRVVTNFWRRSTQPATPDAFRVDRVYTVKGAAA
jgi:hypothetical protein